MRCGAPYGTESGRRDLRSQCRFARVVDRTSAVSDGYRASGKYAAVVEIGATDDRHRLRPGSARAMVTTHAASRRSDELDVRRTANRARSRRGVIVGGATAGRGIGRCGADVGATRCAGSHFGSDSVDEAARGVRDNRGPIDGTGKRPRAEPVRDVVVSAHGGRLDFRVAHHGRSDRGGRDGTGSKARVVEPHGLVERSRRGKRPAGQFDSRE